MVCQWALTHPVNFLCRFKIFHYRNLGGKVKTVVPFKILLWVFYIKLGPEKLNLT